MSTVMPDWTDLPPELLALIASKLHPFDCSQFRAASRAFAAACIVPKAPLLLLPGSPGKRSTFLCIANNTQCRARLPCLDGRYCVGSQDDWLITLDAFLEPALLNPITGQEVKLPSMATLPFIRHAHGPDGSITSIFYAYGDYWYELTPRNYAGLAIERAVLSCSPDGGEGGFVIAALLDVPRKMIWTRSGEDKWHFSVESDAFRFSEVGFHKGQLFGMTSSGLCRVRLDDDGAPAAAELICEHVGRPMHSRRVYLFTDRESGDLMLAQRYYSYDGTRIRTTGIDIVRFDTEHRTSAVVEGLGSRALFVSAGTAVLVSAAAGEEGVKANCVYFEDGWWDYWDDELEMKRGVEIYHLEDGSVERCLCAPHPLRSWPPPVWISSKLPLGLGDFEVEREEKRPPGRPRKQRRHKCSRCKQLGHNVRTCKKPIGEEAALELTTMKRKAAIDASSSQVEPNSAPLNSCESAVVAANTTKISAGKRSRRA